MLTVSGTYASAFIYCTGNSNLNKTTSIACSASGNTDERPFGINQLPLTDAAGSIIKTDYRNKTDETLCAQTAGTDGIEPYALAQIKAICDNPVAAGSKIRIMPDVHPGKIGVIGLSMTISDRILPNLLGADLGCGVLLAKLKCRPPEWQKLDRIIRERIPSGFSLRKEMHRQALHFDFSRLRCVKYVDVQRARLSLGTLGSGNHFIEVDRDANGAFYLVIHSGSRYLGKAVTDYYLSAGQKALAEQGYENTIPHALTWLSGNLMADYIHDSFLVQEFAEQNRQIMRDEILRGMKWNALETISCVHNFLEALPAESTQKASQANQNAAKCTPSFLLRKGAISAKKGEPVVIPINMRDGILLGTGLGNPDWNETAPHGAGRIFRRDAVKEHFTVSSFKAAMKGIYTSCISKETLDEAPFAYRGIDEIKEAIKDSVRVCDMLRPVYNFKFDAAAHGKNKTYQRN